MKIEKTAAAGARQHTIYKTKDGLRAVPRQLRRQMENETQNDQHVKDEELRRAGQRRDAERQAEKSGARPAAAKVPALRKSV